MRVAAAIPFVGYVILLNDRLSRFFSIYAEFDVFSMNAPWNLLLIYYGAISTGLGAFVYAARCPAFLKRYEVFADYRTAERELWGNTAFAERKSAEIEAEVEKRRY